MNKLPEGILNYFATFTETRPEGRFEATRVSSGFRFFCPDYLAKDNGGRVGTKSGLESPLAAKILVILKEGTLGKSGMASELGHKTVSGELHKQVKRLQGLDLIEMTIPGMPNSRPQKHRLTEKGRRFLKEK